MESLALKLREGMGWARQNKLCAALLVALWTLALASIAQGFRHAAHFSTDFQWSPTVLLSEGVNPYQVAISGNAEGRLLMSQYPPYLELLYIVMLPLAYLPYTLAKLSWAILNLGFACASLAILARLFRLSAFQGALLASLFFLSTPYRNTVGNGQTSLLCLLTFLIAWIYENRNETASGASLSLLLTKYSFAPPIGLWFLLRGKLKMLLISLALLTVGWLLFSWMCHENPLKILGQPVKVASLYAESEGGGDIMTLVQSFGWDRPVVGDLRLSAVIGLLTSCVWVGFLRLKSARLTRNDCLAALCLVSLLSIRHLAYDLVFLAPVMALTFSRPRLSQIALIAALAYLGFGLKLLTVLDIAGRWVELLSFLAINFMLVLVLATARDPANSPSPSPEAA